MSDDNIIIPKTDLPKRRDLTRVDLIKRKKGAHPDCKKQADKNKCRQKVKEDE